MVNNKIKRNELIIKKCCVGFAQYEIEHFLYVVEKTGLDPLMNQIYAMKIKNRTTNEERLSIQTSIDGLRLLAERSGNYSPGEDVEYEYDENGNIEFAKAAVKKRTEDGTWHLITARAYWKEYAKTGNVAAARFWNQLPHLMIAKCAEALALRKAFPQDLSGLYIKEEMDQATKDESDYINDEQISVLQNMMIDLTQEKYRYLLKILNVNDLSKISKQKYEDVYKVVENFINKYAGEKTNESRNI